MPNPAECHLSLSLHLACPVLATLSIHSLDWERWTAECVCWFYLPPADQELQERGWAISSLYLKTFTNIDTPSHRTPSPPHKWLILRQPPKGVWPHLCISQRSREKRSGLIHISRRILEAHLWKVAGSRRVERAHRSACLKARQGKPNEKR